MAHARLQTHEAPVTEVDVKALLGAIDEDGT